MVPFFFLDFCPFFFNNSTTAIQVLEASFLFDAFCEETPIRPLFLVLESDVSGRHVWIAWFGIS